MATTAAPLSAAVPQPRFVQDLFRQPGAGHRGAPFWSWNGKLERTRLFRQLAVFRDMGLGGAHLHSRTGLQTPYLGPEWMQLVKDCADEAERLGLLTWLYDEDRWPSGFAGGLAVTDRKHWCRHLRLTRERLTATSTTLAPVHHGRPLPLEERTFIAGWALRFSAGVLTGQRRIGAHDAVGGDEIGLWGWLEIPPAKDWFNNRQYANLLDPAATAEFLRVTHEAYHALLGERFGGSVPAIFTDEPLFRGMDRPRSTEDSRDLCIAWADDLAATYRARWGEDLLDTLPAVLFQCADGHHARDRWRFHDHHTDRFVHGFAAPVGAWCQAHDIRLTGHMMAEQSLADQTNWVGEAMRSLRHFQLPGIDLLCDQLELSTAKQAQSVARQCGRDGVLSELYGVTNWDFPFAGHKRQGDWQAALGITVRVHHLTWYGMAGEAKRDYPASFGEHVPWWREYAAVEDHFARLNTALLSGRPLCRVALLHPIESHWVANGPADACAAVQSGLEQGFQDSLRWLLEGLIDADLAAESLLEELSPIRHDQELAVGQMRYHAMVIPPVLTLRRSTVARLAAFAEAGGRILRLGPAPDLFDGEPDPGLRATVASWPELPCRRDALLAALAPLAEVDLRRDGRAATGVLHQLREEDDGSRIVFLCRFLGDDLYGARLRLRGHWRVQELDTARGESAPRAARWEAGWTVLDCDLPAAGHLLLRLTAAATAWTGPVAAGPSWKEHARLVEPDSIALDEPNVLLLDRAAWKLDEGGWQPEEEVLRLDNLVRAALGQGPRNGDIAQPWVEPPRPDTHRVTLAYALRVDHATGPLRLALEDAGRLAIRLDGQPIANRSEGCFIDPDLATIALPALTAGEHRLEITWPCGGGTGLESCYVLGDFGVRVVGHRAHITAPVRTLSWGDWTMQGLPFYGGNVTYRCRLDAEGGPLALRVPRFRAPLLAVALDGTRVGRIWRSPWRLELGDVSPGRHELAVTAFGSRCNTLGQVHNIHHRGDSSSYRWWGPQSWRTRGDDWADEYQLRTCGVLVAPQVERG